MKSRQPESRTPPARRGGKWIAVKGRGPDTTSQSGRQLNWYKGRHMNSRQPESQSLPAIVAHRWIDIMGDKAREPDTTSQTGRQFFPLLPVVPARGGAEVALGIYFKTLFIYRICTGRAPARPARACFVRSCCTGGTCARPRRNTTPSEHFPHTSQCMLHTLHFTLHICTSHSTLHLNSNHVSSSHLISALLISSHLFSHVKVNSSQLFSSHPSTDQPFSSPRGSYQLIVAVLHARKLLLSERSLLHKKPLGAESFCTQTLETQMHSDKKAFPKDFFTTKLAHSTSQYYFVLQSLHRYVPVLPWTTKLAQSTSEYYFVL